MDKDTLTTIVVTAAVTAAVMELAGGLTRRMAKAAAMLSSEVSARLGRNWRLVDCLLEGAQSLAQFTFAWWLSRSAPVVTGGVVFCICLLSGFGFLYLREFAEKLAAYRRDGR